MKKIKVEIKDSSLKGYVVVNIPKPAESAMLSQEFQFKEKNGEIVERSAPEKVEQMYKIAEKHLVEVCAVTEDGLEIKNAEDLGYDEDGRVFLQKVAAMVFNGVKLSPKSFAQ